MKFLRLALFRPGGSTTRPEGQSLRVLYFAVRDIGYPRNERLRAFLENELGAEVDVLSSTISGGRFHRYFSQFKLVFQEPGDYDLVVLSEFSLHFFPFSWLVAKRNGARHVVDFFVGLHETEVGDDKSTDRRSFRARLLAWVDRMAIRSADACFTDTEVRARRFSELDGGRTPFASLPVGAPPWALEAELQATPSASEANQQGPVRLLYYGSYLALHGLANFIDALGQLDELDFSLLMIGKGPDRQDVEDLVMGSPLRHRVTFLDYAEPEVLVGHIDRADILIGVFGESDKAAEVIPNKVWQGLYLGKIVVTRASAALDEISHVAGPLLVQVTSSSPQAIGSALWTASSELETVAIDSGLKAHIRISLEQLVFDRYWAAFGREPFARLFHTSSGPSASARAIPTDMQGAKQQALIDRSIESP
jgi:glycosyltransferase involved in cell wall biosynthesis